MKKNIKTGLTVVVIAFCLSGNAFAGELEDGQAAYARSDYFTAFRLLMPLAKQGDPKAQLRLALMYGGGQGVPKNTIEAMKWFRKSAEQENAFNQNYLGILYRDGIDVPQDYNEAVRWFRKSAEQGYAHAQHNLGVMYDNGKGVSQDDIEAAKWYRLSAEQGNAGAQNNLGVNYDNGKGVPQDYVQAHMWFNLAAAGLKDKTDREGAASNRDMVAEKMTPAQIAEAQKLAREWKPKGSDLRK